MFKTNPNRSLTTVLQAIRQEIVSAYESHPQLTSLKLMSLAGATGMLIVIGTFCIWPGGGQDRATKSTAAAPIAEPVISTMKLCPTKPEVPDSPAPQAKSRALAGEHAQSAAEVARKQSQEMARMQQQQQLAHQRQQAQLALDQAAADYEFALQQWNAELAACQPGPPPGYTPNQRGRFAAMGVRPQQQQRQPNQILLERARQAEQRFLQAQLQHQQLTTAN